MSLAIFNRIPRTWYFVATLAVAILVLPKLLTGFDGPSTKLPYEFASYWVGFKFTVGLVFFYAVGVVFLSKLRQEKNNHFPVFTTAAIGWAVVCGYIYLRSLLNAWPGIPITATEIVLLGFLAIYLLIREAGFEAFIAQCTAMVPGLFFFWLLATAMAQHELPRDIMLSSDPDQHVFFASQIARLGGVPFHQGEWGSLSFGYPAGTGVLIFAVQALSFVDISDATMALPVLQTYLAALIIAELAIKPDVPWVQRLFVFSAILLVVNYILPYGFEASHYHLEGYGRLSSLWIFALLLVLFVHKNTGNDVAKDIGALHFMLLIGGLVAMGIVLNPVNAFLAAAMAGLAFCIRFPHKIYLVIFIPILGVLFACLDPYYIENLMGTARSTGGVELINTPPATDYNAITERIPGLFSDWSARPHLYFELPYVPSGLIALLSLLLFLNLQGKSDEQPLLLRTAALVIILYVLWALLSGVFEAVSADHRLRLLFPYLQYNRFQIVYLITLMLIAWPMASWFSDRIQLARSVVALILLGYGLATIQDLSNVANKKARRGYCGSMGCTTADDRAVLRSSEQIFREYTSEPTIPRMLIPNAIAIHGNERWLMPRGGSRSAPLYDTFPLAFYYYQGDEIYTFGHYQNHVCQNLDIAWLESVHIQFLFTPSEMSDTCVAQYGQLADRFDVVARSGNSAIYKLY